MDKKDVAKILSNYISKGYKMFPCGEKSKVPVVASWVNECSNDFHELVTVYDEHPELNLAIVTGETSNLFIIDVDNKGEKNGSDSLVMLEMELGQLPTTMRVKTPNGGEHYYFKYPAGLPTNSRLGNKVNFADGLDVRADGGYVLAPPSRLEAGEYEILCSEQPKEIPVKWLNYIYQKQYKITETDKKNRDGSSLLIMIREEFQLPEIIKSGERNDLLMRYCGKLISQGLSEDEIREEIIKVNTERCVEPLPMREIEATIFSSVTDYVERRKNEINEKQIKLNDDGTYRKLTWLSVNPKTGSITIDDLKYAKYYVDDICGSNLFYVEGTFRDKNMNYIDGNEITTNVMMELGEYIPVNLMKRVDGIMKTIKQYCLYELPDEELAYYDRIYCKNNDMMLKYDGRSGCFNLMEEVRTKPVINAINMDLGLSLIKKRNSYTLKENAPYFHRWITDLLEPRESDILQEYLGYCLVPSTRAQVALQIVGPAGIGKSRIADIINLLIGRDKVSVTDLATLEEDKYLANVISNKMVLYDDDLKVQSLKDTGMLKTLISANDLSIRVQEKFEKAFNLRSCAKILACGNHMLSSLYDRSDGLWRRFIVLQSKPLNPNREIIMYDEFLHEFRKEKDYIFLWVLDGLERLIRNKFVFSHQEIIKKGREALKINSDSVEGFLTECPNLRLTQKHSDLVPYTYLYRYYDNWCKEEGLASVKDRIFYRTMKEKLQLAYPNIEYKNMKVQSVSMKCFVGIKWLSNDELYEEEKAKKKLEKEREEE